jgi:hypothetical protein
MPQYRTPEAKSTDDLRVSTVTTSFLPIERSAPISVCVYTYSSGILEEAQLQKHFTYTYGYPTIDTLLQTRSSAQAKCTYGEDTLQLKDIEHKKLSLD